MDVKTLQWIFQDLKNDNLSFVYQGGFNDIITSRIIELSEHNVKVSELNKIKKKVSFIIIECFQNVIRHSKTEQLPQLDSNGLFVARNIGRTYSIFSANLVNRNSIFELQIKLDSLQSMKKEELHAMYMNLLETGQLSESGGAGLGLLEMARKSKNKINYEFDLIDDDHAFFYFNVNIDGNIDASSSNDVENVDIQSVMELHKVVLFERILLLYQGDFTQKSILPLLEMIENNLEAESDNRELKSNILHTLIELSQNVVKHGKEIDGMTKGILLIRSDKDNIVVSIGNLVDTEKVDELDHHLTLIQQKDAAELKTWHREIIAANRNSEDINSGLGLIDVVRFTKERIQHAFLDHDNSLSFFAISLNFER
jgi:hypothetical protein